MNEGLENKNNAKNICNRLTGAYKFIFKRLYMLFADADNEWNAIISEKTDYIQTRQLYFIPLLYLLIAVTFTVEAITHWEDGLFFESLFKNTLLPGLAFFISYILVVMITGGSLAQKIFKEEKDLDKASLLVVFPYCLFIIGFVLESLITHLFILQYVAVICSIVLTWKGATMLYPEMSANKRFWFSLFVLVLICLGNSGIRAILDKMMS